MLSNTAVPKYYGEFRDAVIRGEIPINAEIEMEMHRIDDLIDDPDVWYDDDAIKGFIEYCEEELTLTDGSDVKLLDSFKLWPNRFSVGMSMKLALCQNHEGMVRSAISVSGLRNG